MIDVSAERIFEVLGGRRSGTDKYRCFCPSHDDGKSPSLSLTQRGDKVLFHCFGECSSLEVRGALIDMGLWPEPGKSKPKEEYLTEGEIEYMRLYNNIFMNDNRKGIPHPQNEIDTYKKYKAILRKVDVRRNST